MIIYLQRSAQIQPRTSRLKLQVFAVVSSADEGGLRRPPLESDALPPQYCSIELIEAETEGAGLGTAAAAPA